MADIEHMQYIKVPAAKVYEAITTEKGLGATWTTQLIVQPEVGFINQFDFDDNYATKMKVVELVENEKVVWECIAADSEPAWVGTSVSFELAEKDGRTAVLFRHLNWKEVSECFRFCNYNWAMFLFSLKSYCETGTGTPYQLRVF
jgi:uncharacterized protein YndB with AHSA1/START domain